VSLFLAALGLAPFRPIGLSFWAIGPPLWPSPYRALRCTAHFGSRPPARRGLPPPAVARWPKCDTLPARKPSPRSHTFPSVTRPPYTNLSAVGALDLCCPRRGPVSDPHLRWDQVFPAGGSSAAGRVQIRPRRRLAPLSTSSSAGCRSVFVLSGCRCTANLRRRACAATASRARWWHRIPPKIGIHRRLKTPRHHGVADNIYHKLSRHPAEVWL
jgi:hypothetical protein